MLINPSQSLPPTDPYDELKEVTIDLPPYSRRDSAQMQGLTAWIQSWRESCNTPSLPGIRAIQWTWRLGVSRITSFFTRIFESLSCSKVAAPTKLTNDETVQYVKIIARVNQAANESAGSPIPSPWPADQEWDQGLPDKDVTQWDDDLTRDLRAKIFLEDLSSPYTPEDFNSIYLKRREQDLDGKWYQKQFITYLKYMCSQAFTNADASLLHLQGLPNIPYRWEHTRTHILTRDPITNEHLKDLQLTYTYILHIQDSKQVAEVERTYTLNQYTGRISFQGQSLRELVKPQLNDELRKQRLNALLREDPQFHLNTPSKLIKAYGTKYADTISPTKLNKLAVIILTERRRIFLENLLRTRFTSLLGINVAILIQDYKIQYPSESSIDLTPIASEVFENFLKTYPLYGCFSERNLQFLTVANLKDLRILAEQGKFPADWTTDKILKTCDMIAQLPGAQNLTPQHLNGKIGSRELVDWFLEIFPKIKKLSTWEVLRTHPSMLAAATTYAKKFKQSLKENDKVLFQQINEMRMYGLMASDDWTDLQIELVKGKDCKLYRMAIGSDILFFREDDTSKIEFKDGREVPQELQFEETSPDEKKRVLISFHQKCKKVIEKAIKEDVGRSMYQSSAKEGSLLYTNSNIEEWLEHLRSNGASKATPCITTGFLTQRVFEGDSVKSRFEARPDDSWAPFKEMTETREGRLYTIRQIGDYVYLRHSLFNGMIPMNYANEFTPLYAGLFHPTIILNTKTNELLHASFDLQLPETTFEKTLAAFVPVPASPVTLKSNQKLDQEVDQEVAQTIEDIRNMDLNVLQKQMAMHLRLHGAHDVGNVSIQKEPKFDRKSKDESSITYPVQIQRNGVFTEFDWTYTAVSLKKHIEEMFDSEDPTLVKILMDSNHRITMKFDQATKDTIRKIFKQEEKLRANGDFFRVDPRVAIAIAELHRRYSLKEKSNKA